MLTYKVVEIQGISWIFKFFRFHWPPCGRYQCKYQYINVIRHKHTHTHTHTHTHARAHTPHHTTPHTRMYAQARTTADEHKT